MIRSLGVSLLFSVAMIVVTSLPVSAGLIGISASAPSVVYSIDSATGTATPLVSTTFESAIVGLEYLNGTVYVSDIKIGDDYHFGSIDLGTGAFTPINVPGGSLGWYSLAGDPVAGVLYAVDGSGNPKLVSVTPGGVVTDIGPTDGPVPMAGLAFDSLNGILYGAGDGDLYTFNLSTGSATLVGSTGLGFNVNAGLAYDAATGTLYLNSAETNSLYSVNAGTGLATLIGPNLQSGIEGLAFIPDAAAVPEPGSLLIVALGGAAIALKQRRPPVAARRQK